MNDKCYSKSKRQETMDLLRKRPELRWDNHNIFHGRLKHFLPSCAPVVTWDDQGSGKSKLPATELRDQRDVLLEKVGFVVKLLLESGHTSFYTGAGVSTSAGVQQIARGSQRRLRRPHTTNAQVRGLILELAVIVKCHLQPNYSHVALVELVRAGLVRSWVTTNYDGLAQKSGCPQDTVTEIRGEAMSLGFISDTKSLFSGSWFDPTNPVLKRRDKPRRDLLERAEAIGRDTDLMLALGTSLSLSPGSFLPQAVARRAQGPESECLGLVIVGLQQSPLDHLATLRVFCDLDTFLKLVLDRLRHG